MSKHNIQVLKFEYPYIYVTDCYMMTGDIINGKYEVGERLVNSTQELGFHFQYELKEV